MLCPACKVQLMVADRQGVEIDSCPTCPGIWLDRGELDKLIERSPGDAPRPWTTDLRSEAVPRGRTTTTTTATRVSAAGAGRAVSATRPTSAEIGGGATAAEPRATRRQGHTGRTSMRSTAADSAAQERHVAESELVETGFALRNRRIGELMRPRAAIAWLDADRPLEEQWQTVGAAEQDAFPVCRGGLDHVLGAIGPRQVRSAFLAGGRLDLARGLEEPLRLPRTLRLMAALEAMRPTGAELALVVDDGGAVVGAVTARGLLEELAAEVSSSIRPPRPESIRRADGSWLLDGMHPIVDFRMLFGRDRAADGDEQAYRTLAGLVLTRLGRLPSIGDTLEWEGLRIEVVDLDGRRIDKLLVTPVA